MGKRRGKQKDSYTLPSSPTSSSSSDFEFTISISPRKSSTALCPADELFYKGQLLPLHLSPRISMVRTILLSSSSTSSSSTAPRDSTASSNSNDCDSSRPSSVTEDDELKRLHNPTSSSSINNNRSQIKKSSQHRYFSLSRFSSVFRKETTTKTGENVTAGNSSSVKRMSATAKEVFRKYLKKVKPLYEKLSQATAKTERSGGKEVSCGKTTTKDVENVAGGTTVLSHSFSGNLRYPRRRRSCVSSCPSSMRSSPSHSGVLSQNGGVLLLNNAVAAAVGVSTSSSSSSSSMEELQSAIQGAIAHCKNSLIQNKTTTTTTVGVSHEIN